MCKIVCIFKLDLELWLWSVMFAVKINCGWKLLQKIRCFFWIFSDGLIFANLNNVFMYTPTNHLRCGEYLSDREKETFTTRAGERQKERLLQYLHGWNDYVGGGTCECRLLRAVSGKWVLSGKRRAALVRQSAPRPAERQSRFHGFSLFSALARRQTSSR